MRRSNKKNSRILMAGVLAASIVMGNAHWLATAEEIDNSTEAVASAEETPTQAEAGNQPAGTEQAAAEQSGSAQSGAGEQTDSAQSSAGEQTGGNQTDAGEQTGGDQSDAGEQTGGNQTEDPNQDDGDQTEDPNQNGGDQTEDPNQTDGNQSDGTDENGSTVVPAEENTDDAAKENSGSKQQETEADREPAETGQVKQNNVATKTNEDVKIESSYPAVESNSQWTGDSVPGWANSIQEYISGNLGVAEQYRLLEQELNERVNRALETFSIKDKSVTYEESNILDIFAIYAVKHDMTDDFPYNVEFKDQESREELVAIFNRMTRVNKLNSDNLMVVRLSYEDVIDEYELDDAQKAAVASLVNDDNRTLLQEMYETSILSQLTDEEFSAIQTELSTDIIGARRSVLLAALSLEGKVNYFWGGKSYHIGWDERWGQQGLVTAAGSSSTGSIRGYGLDCSGFVSWAFINGGGDQSVIAYIGNGTASQFSNSYEISWEEAQPGDIVFYKAPNAGGINHVGIVVSNDDSDGIKIVHCSSGNNGVVVTGKAGFQYIRRPYIYSESSESGTES